MSKRGEHKVREVIGNVNDPRTLYHQMLPFLSWLRVRNYSERTVVLREINLCFFIQWCDERGLAHPQEITRPILMRYQRYMFLYRKKDGKALSAASQCQRISALRTWFAWLCKNNLILYNPASDLELPRMEYRIPKSILTSAEADRVMNVPDISTAKGLRDRAMLETMYSCGIRRTELIGLHLGDVDDERGMLLIRQGKGKKDRMIPIGDRALVWIQKYRDESREQFALAKDDGILFLSKYGEAISPVQMTHLVGKIVDDAGIGKRGSCHMFRHTMATLMLENGADTRFIQAMLGHTDLTSTQIYMHVSMVKLKEVHTLTHPAQLQRKGDVHTVSSMDISEQFDGDNDASALLEVLENEAQEEEKTA